MRVMIPGGAQYAGADAKSIFDQIRQSSPFTKDIPLTKFIRDALRRAGIKGSKTPAGALKALIAADWMRDQTDACAVPGLSGLGAGDVTGPATCGALPLKSTGRGWQTQGEHRAFFLPDGREVALYHFGGRRAGWSVGVGYPYSGMEYLDGQGRPAAGPRGDDDGLLTAHRFSTDGAAVAAMNTYLGL